MHITYFTFLLVHFEELNRAVSFFLLSQAINCFPSLALPFNQSVIFIEERVGLFFLYLHFMILRETNVYINLKLLKVISYYRCHRFLTDGQRNSPSLKGI